MSNIAGTPGLDTQGLLRQQRFTNKLEDYIDRSRKGIPAQDNTVTSELSGKLSYSSDFLSANNPRLLKKYSAYTTAFSYDKRGRFVSNLEGAFNNMSTILSLKA